MSTRKTSMKECAKLLQLVALASCAGFFLLGCAQTEESRMEQAIEMGPYVFEVERTEHHSFYDGTEIHVLVRIRRDDAAPFTTTFDEFVLGNWELTDKARNTFDCSSIVPLSGNRRSSDQWVAEFRIWTHPMMGVRVRDRTRIGKRASDFRLIIKNPDPRGKQPRRVSIPLR